MWPKMQCHIKKENISENTEENDKEMKNKKESRNETRSYDALENSLLTSRSCLQLTRSVFRLFDSSWDLA